MISYGPKWIVSSQVYEVLYSLRIATEDETERVKPEHDTNNNPSYDS